MSERDVFTAALQIADPAERSAYLGQACAGDAALRQRVEMLLKTHGRAGDFLERPVAEPIEADGATAAIDTAARPGPTSPPTESGDDEKDAPLDFLQASSKPGSLGRLGHYEVLEVLGHGGFGIVLKAFDEMLQRVVAVKVHGPADWPPRPRPASASCARPAPRPPSATRTSSPSTPSRSSRIPYLVMEFIAGETLQQKLDRIGPLDAPGGAADRPADRRGAGRGPRDGPDPPRHQAGQHPAGRAASQQRQDHRLRPGPRRRRRQHLTQSGVIAGTPMYMAPEQAQGEPIDHRADLFSLGSVLYAMCSGRPPFRASTTLAVLKRVAEDAAAAHPEIIPEAPEWLCEIIAKLHAKNPDDRFHRPGKWPTCWRAAWRSRKGQSLSRRCRTWRERPIIRAGTASRDRVGWSRRASPCCWRARSRSRYGRAACSREDGGRRPRHPGQRAESGSVR